MIDLSQLTEDQINELQLQIQKHKEEQKHKDNLKNLKGYNMTDYITSLIDTEFTPSEKEAVLLQVKDIIGTGRKIETYREQRGDKNVLMVRVYNNSIFYDYE